MKDFDAFVQERAKNAPTFKLFGVLWKLPPQLRYDAVLQMRAFAKRNGSDQLSEDEAFETFEQVLGTELLSELRKHDGFTIELASEIVAYALEQYGLSAGVESNDPKSRAKKVSRPTTS